MTAENQVACLAREGATNEAPQHCWRLRPVVRSRMQDAAADAMANVFCRHLELAELSQDC